MATLGSCRDLWHHGRGDAPASQPRTRAPGAPPDRHSKIHPFVIERGHHMTSNHGDEATLDNPSLSRLPVLASDPARADRTRRRCRALLNRQHRRREQILSRAHVERPRLAPVILGLFCVLYTIYVGALLATI